MSIVANAPARLNFVRRIVRETGITTPASKKMRARVLDDYLTAHGLNLSDDDRADMVRTIHGR